MLIPVSDEVAIMDSSKSFGLRESLGGRLWPNVLTYEALLSQDIRVHQRFKCITFRTQGNANPRISDG